MLFKQRLRPGTLLRRDVHRGTATKRLYHFRVQDRAGDCLEASDCDRDPLFDEIGKEEHKQRSLPATGEARPDCQCLWHEPNAVVAHRETKGPSCDGGTLRKV